MTDEIRASIPQYIIVENGIVTVKTARLIVLGTAMLQSEHRTLFLLAVLNLT